MSVRETVGSRWFRLAVAVAVLVVAPLLIWWRGPDWNRVWDAFAFVQWWWVVLALLLNLGSTVARAVAWRLTIGQALPEPRPALGQVFSAFGIGLLGNAALPARAGEVARVAVLRRHVDQGPGTTATLLGTVFAHRLFDLPATALLVVYVLLTAKIPHWAVTALVGFFLVGVMLLALAMLTARRGGGHVVDASGTVRTLVRMARQGLAVLRAPLTAGAAVCFQILGWFLQLLAVWMVMKAFEIDAPLPAAGLVLLLMNVATIFPLWPGNFGLLQAAVALPLVQYGVAYPTGFAFGIVLQAIEMSVGVGIGLVFLAREGLSFATLKRIDSEDTSQEDVLGGPALTQRPLSAPPRPPSSPRPAGRGSPVERCDEVVPAESS